MGQVIYSCFANKKARLQFWNKFHSQRLPNDRLISDLHVCLITISITTDIFVEFVNCKLSTIKDNNAYEALVSSNLLKSQPNFGQIENSFTSLLIKKNCGTVVTFTSSLRYATVTPLSDSHLGLYKYMYIKCRTVGKSENPGVPVVISWACVICPPIPWLKF